MISAFVHQLFVEPIAIGGVWRLVMLAPLALMISVVYKTIRCEKISSVPVASIRLCITIVVGMMLIGLVLLLAFHLLS